jgi:LPS export ABC transporter protein LptC
MKSIRIAFLIISLPFFLIMACSKTEYPREKNASAALPDASLDDAIIILTQDGRQDAVVKARHIDRWDAQDSTEAQTVFVTLYDSLGVGHSTLSGKRGLLREQSAKFSIFGDVVGIAKDSTVLNTQSLFWDPRTELITTDDYVEIKRPDGDVLKGWGFRADRDLRNIEIAKNVSGKVKNVPESEQAPAESAAGGNGGRAGNDGD